MPVSSILDQLEVAAVGAGDHRQAASPSLRAPCWRCLRAASRARRDPSRAAAAATSSRLPGSHASRRIARLGAASASTCGAQRPVADQCAGAVATVARQLAPQLDERAHEIQRVLDLASARHAADDDACPAESAPPAAAHARRLARPEALGVDAVADVRDLARRECRHARTSHSLQVARHGDEACDRAGLNTRRSAAILAVGAVRIVDVPAVLAVDAAGTPASRATSAQSSVPKLRVCTIAGRSARSSCYRRTYAPESLPGRLFSACTAHVGAPDARAEVRGFGHGDDRVTETRLRADR